MRARQARDKTVGSLAQLHQIYRGNATPTRVCLLGATVSFGAAADTAAVLERSMLKLQWDFFACACCTAAGNGEARAVGCVQSGTVSEEHLTSRNAARCRVEGSVARGVRWLKRWRCMRGG